MLNNPISVPGIPSAGAGIPQVSPFAEMLQAIGSGLDPTPQMKMQQEDVKLKQQQAESQKEQLAQQKIATISQIITSSPDRAKDPAFVASATQAFKDAGIAPPLLADGTLDPAAFEPKLAPADRNNIRNNVFGMIKGIPAGSMTPEALQSALSVFDPQALRAAGLDVRTILADPAILGGMASGVQSKIDYYHSLGILDTTKANDMKAKLPGQLRDLQLKGDLTGMQEKLFGKKVQWFDADMQSKLQKVQFDEQMQQKKYELSSQRLQVELQKVKSGVVSRESLGQLNSAVRNMQSAYNSDQGLLAKYQAMGTFAISTGKDPSSIQAGVGPDGKPMMLTEKIQQLQQKVQQDEETLKSVPSNADIVNSIAGRNGIDTPKVTGTHGGGAATGVGKVDPSLLKFKKNINGKWYYKTTPDSPNTYNEDGSIANP